MYVTLVERNNSRVKWSHIIKETDNREGTFQLLVIELSSIKDECMDCTKVQSFKKNEH